MENEIIVKEGTTAQGMPVDFSAKLKMAETLVKSGLLPNGMSTPEKVVVALQWGYELGLSPMVAINNIAVVYGKPSLSTDMIHAIVRKSHEYGGVQWIKQDDKAAECIVKRLTPNFCEEVRGIFTIEDAKKAGLADKDNWKKYPSRMLKHRALSYALRDAFPDMISGLYNEDEIAEISAPKEINITPPAELEKKEAVSPAKLAEEVSKEEKPKAEEIF